MSEHEVTNAGEDVVAMPEISEEHKVRERDLNTSEAVGIYKRAVEEENSKNRRKKKDWVAWMPSILSSISWLVLLGAWVSLEAAAPEVEWGFLASFGRLHFDMEPELRQGWDAAFLNLTYILLVVSIGLCAIGLVFNFMRKKRKSDKISISIMITASVSVTALVLLLTTFGRYIF